MTTYYNPYYYPNYQRPEISYFSGENVDGWLYELECFFYRYQTTMEQKLAITTSYLAGDALEWYRQWCWDMRLSWRIGTWEDFAADLRCRFWSEPLTRPSVILESMSKTCDGIIQLLTEMKNENSVYMSDLSKLKTQVSSISTCGSSANKVEESDLNCELSAAEVVSTDCEKFESASAEIELALIDVTVTEMTTENILVSKVDEAAESGDDDYDLDVHLHFDLNIDDVVDFTQPEVTPNHLSPDNHIVTVTKTDEYADLKEEIRSETSLCDLISSFSFCTLPVCENASVYLPSFRLAHKTFNGSWCSIQLFYIVAVYLNPPWEPPDDRTRRELKFMSLPMSENDEIENISGEDLRIVWKEAETKKGVTTALESMLNIDILDDYVAELEKSVYGLFASFARLYVLNSRVGQTAGKVGDHLLSTNAEWETASQITNFTKYLNDYKLDKMWQGLFLTLLRVHMIYSSPEEDLVWSTLLKIKILDNNWVAGKTASHKLSLKVNMSSMLSKDDWVRIEMNKVKFDDSYRSAACVDGWEDDYIRALGGRHIDDKYGTSQENDISALKNYMGAGFLGKDDIGTPSKLVEGVMSRKVRHTASRLIHLCVGQGWRSAYMGQEDLLFSQSRSIIRGPFEELCSKEPSSNFGDIWEPSCEEDSIKITLKSRRKSIFRQILQTVLQEEVVSIETQVRAAGLWTFYFNICHDEWVICLRYVKLVISEVITEFLLNFLGFLSSQFGCSDVVYECNLWGFCLSDYIGILCGGWIMNDALVHFSLDLALREGNFEKLCGETENCLLAGVRKFKWTWTTVEAKFVPAAVAILLEKELFRAGEDEHIIIDSVNETYDLNLRKYTTPAVKEALNFDVRVELRGEILLNPPGAAPSTVCVIGLGSDEVQLLGDLANEDVDDDYLCTIYYAISESMIGIKAFEGKEKSKDMCVGARCEIHNVIELDNQIFFLIMSTTNEPYLGYICVGQRKKLEIFWCVVITYELKSNLIAKWLAQVQLACTNVKMVFVSRIYTGAKFHLNFLVLAGFKQEVFATQVTIWDIAVGFGSPAMNLLYHLSFWFSSPRPPESNKGKSNLSRLERTFAGRFIITDRYNHEVETYFIFYGGAVARGPWRSICTDGSGFDNIFLDDFVSSSGYINHIFMFSLPRPPDNVELLTLRTRSF